MEKVSNFEEGCKFFEQDLSQDELYSYLKNGELFERQLACIRLETCKTEDEAAILMENLTGIDGKVREAVSFKLRSFIAENPELFEKENFYNIFLDSIIDINGNICRNIITALEALTTNKNFCEYFVKEVTKRALDVTQTIENFDYKDRKYVTNKEIFKLYWYLEVLSIFPELPVEKLSDLIENCAKIEEYTIREKTAQLLSKMPENFSKNFNDLNFDNNFYVNLALRK